MARHVVHHEGSPRPDGFGVIVLMVLVIIALGVLGAVLQGIGLILTKLAPIAVGLAALGAIGWVAWYLVGRIRRMQLELWWLKRRLDKKIHRYTKARTTAAALSAENRAIAERQLAQLRDACQTVCDQLRGLLAELVKAKQTVLTKLGKVPAEKLAAKLAPYTAMEVEISELLAGFREAQSSRNE